MSTPAFPFNEKSGDGSHWHSHSGMSLLDYFAGQALAGFMALPNSIMGPADTAKIAYEFADAMMAERERRT